MIPFEHLSLDTLTATGAIAAVTDLLNGPAYGNPRYRPTLAPRRPSALAGSSDYLEVEDTLIVDVLGATAANASRNLETLFGLIDQAAEWGEGKAVDAVQIRLRAQRSTVGDVRAIILGPPPGQNPGALAAEFDVPAGGTQACWIIRNVEVRFRRRGRFLATTTESAVSVPRGVGLADAVGTGLTVRDIAAPTIASWYLTDVTDGFLNGVALCADDLDGAPLGPLNVVSPGDQLQALGVLPILGFSGVAGANRSLSATLLRSNPSVNAVEESTGSGGDLLLSGIHGGYRLIGAVLVVRNNSATATWRVRAQITTEGVTGARLTNAWTGDAIVDGGSVQPQVVVLPPASVQVEAGSTRDHVYAIGVTRLAGSGSLDIDSLALIALDATGATVVAVSTPAGTVDGRQVSLVHGEYPEQVPIESATSIQRYGTDGRGPLALGNTIVASPPSGTYLFEYRGDLAIASQGAVVVGALLVTDGANWRPGIPGDVADVQFAVVRRPAVLTPQ